MTCPDCQGRGGNTALLCGTRDGRRFSEQRRVTCGACKGTGEVSERQAAWIATGKKLRDHRVHVLKRSGREEAERLGISPILANKHEHGRLCAACLDEDCAECPFTPEGAEAYARDRGRLP